MNRLLLFLIGFSVLFASCDKENPTPTESTLNVRFLLNYGGQPLVFNQNQVYANGDFIKLSTFHFFLSGLNIRNGADSAKAAHRYTPGWFVSSQFVGVVLSGSSRL